MSVHPDRKYHPETEEVLYEVQESSRVSSSSKGEGLGNQNNFLDIRVVEDENGGGHSPNSGIPFIRGMSLYDSEDDDFVDEDLSVSLYLDSIASIDNDEDKLGDEFSSSQLSSQTLPAKNAQLIKEQMKAFIPNLALSFPRGVASEQLSGFFLLADISGFTKLSCTLCAQGSSGIDKLREITNTSFKTLLEIIASHNGDVIAFAGDALLCVFQPQVKFLQLSEDTAQDDSKEKRRGHCGLAAIACAKEICETDLNEINIHCALTHGDMCGATLGGFKNKFAFVLNGNCIEEIGGVLDCAGPGEVVISAQAFHNVVEFCPDLLYREIIPTRGAGALYKIKRKPAFNPNIAGVSRESSQKHIPVSFCNFQNDSIEDLACFLPKPVVNAVISNDIRGLAEIRTVTTMFVSLDSYNGGVCQDLKELQSYFVSMQKCIVDTGGLLRQFLIDDKGCTLIVLWGVPTATYPCNCSRAIKCGVLMKLATRDGCHDISIGISTGSVYCGTVGSTLRREYVAIGRTVNLAARLMGKAKGRILIDSSTYGKLSTNVTKHIREIESIVLKGISKPVVCYEYVGKIIPSSEHERLDKGTVVIETYLKKCIIDVFDSHKFLNGSIMGLQVTKRDASPKKSSKKVMTPYKKDTAACRRARLSTEGMSSHSLKREYTMASDMSKEDCFMNASPSAARRSAPLRTSSKHLMDFEHDWSGFLVIKGSPGSGKTTVASHIVRQYEVVRRLQTSAIIAANASDGAPRKHRNMHLMQSNAALLNKMTSATSKDLHNWVPFVSLEKKDTKGFSSIRKVLKSMLRSYDCMSTVKEEMDEIVHVLIKAYPYHSKKDIVNTIFPFVKRVLDIQWHLCIDSDGEFTACQQRPDSRSDAQVLAHASKSSTFIRKSKNGWDRNLFNETNETLVLADVLRALLNSSIAILVVDDAHNMSPEAWRVFVELSRHPFDPLVILNLLVKESLHDEKTHLSERQGLKYFSKSSHERTMLEMAHSAGRSMARGILELESELCLSQDDYNDLMKSCISVSCSSSEALKSRHESKHSLSTKSSFSSTCHNRYNFLHEIKLEPLSRRGVLELMKVALEVDNLSDDTLQVVYDITHGNPLLLWKIIRYFCDSDYSSIDVAIGQLCDNSLIVALIEGFTNIQKSVLKYCSTIGEEFSFDVLMGVFPKNEKRLSRSQLQDVIDDLVSGGLIVRVSENCYCFKSSMIRRFVYALIPPSVAASMHKDIAVHIERKYSSDTRAHVYSSLSYHYANSNDETGDMNTLKFSLLTAEKYLKENRMMEILPFLQTSYEHMSSRNERDSVLHLVEKSISQIKLLQKSKKTSVKTKSLDLEVLSEILSNLTILRSRLKVRYRSTKEKIVSCILCCGTGGCLDPEKMRRARRRRRAASRVRKVTRTSKVHVSGASQSNEGSS